MGEWENGEPQSFFAGYEQTRRCGRPRSVWSAWSLLPLLDGLRASDSASKLDALHTLRAVRLRIGRLSRNSRDCSQAGKNLQERDEPRNTPNTRKANREEICVPRISRLPRLFPPAFGCGFAALGSLPFNWASFLQSKRGRQPGGCLPVGATRACRWTRQRVSGGRLRGCRDDRREGHGQVFPTANHLADADKDLHADCRHAIPGRVQTRDVG